MLRSRGWSARGAAASAARATVRAGGAGGARGHAGGLEAGLGGGSGVHFEPPREPKRFPRLSEPPWPVLALQTHVPSIFAAAPESRLPSELVNEASAAGVQTQVIAASLHCSAVWPPRSWLMSMVQAWPPEQLEGEVLPPSAIRPATPASEPPMPLAAVPLVARPPIPVLARPASRVLVPVEAPVLALSSPAAPLPAFEVVLPALTLPPPAPLVATALPPAFPDTASIALPPTPSSFTGLPLASSPHAKGAASSATNTLAPAILSRRRMVTSPMQIAFVIEC